MTNTLSTMLPLGTPAPDFCLPDVDGSQVRRASFVGRPLLVMFICNHCPFVRHLRAALAEFGKKWSARGLGIVAINANDAQAYPQDAPDKMAQQSREDGHPFAYLHDATQAVARAYGAACTPDFFLFDAAHRLAYRGQYDDSRPGNGRPIDGHDLQAAAEAVMANLPVAGTQKPSMGCNIKWKVPDAP